MDGVVAGANRAALFLDFDGTLVEIAARPDAVVVPPTLPLLLGRLSQRLGGALAVVSGRPLVELDRLLPVGIVKVGDHGATIRLSPDGPLLEQPLPVPADAWRERAAAFARAWPGTLLENKAYGFALHYRQVPEAEAPARAAMAAIIAGDPDFTLLPARMAWEVVPRGATKGTAVAALMMRAPFRGRAPVFIGDDATDEAGMAAARAAGGHGLRLQERFGTPAALRAWLAQMDECPT